MCMYTFAVPEKEAENAQLSRGANFRKQAEEHWSQEVCNVGAHRKSVKFGKSSHHSRVKIAKAAQPKKKPSAQLIPQQDYHDPESIFELRSTMMDALGEPGEEPKSDELVKVRHCKERGKEFYQVWAGKRIITQATLLQFGCKAWVAAAACGELYQMGYNKKTSKEANNML